MEYVLPYQCVREVCNLPLQQTQQQFITYVANVLLVEHNLLRPH